MSSDINGNRWHWKVTATTNILILLLVLAIAVNSAVILGVQIWFVYDLDSPQEALEQYPGYTVLDTRNDRQMQTWLLRSPEGARVLVTVEKHSFVSQYRIVKSIVLPESHTTARILGDTALLYMTVDGEAIGQYTLTALSISLLKNWPQIPMVFLLYSTLLIGIEIGIYLLVQKIRGK